MKPANIDLIIYQGSTFRKTFTWSTGTPGNTTPVDLTGCQIYSQARSSVLSDTVLFQLSVGDGVTITEPEAGKFELHISAEDTSAFAFKKAVYDIEIVFPNLEGDDTYRLIEGTVVIDPEVTRGLFISLLPEEEVLE